ncbi:hypothetical protein Athai_13940 [Actinocatenispora thailandica]|uniref:Uncharacterized protein n=1 Tax=Actinocatenispora thailandica TaxID=227318 RepID=A0A7R7HVR2_9ACTN|nr:hypothetical protein Athai_13940 [Actinocatenispora thailandica]
MDVGSAFVADAQAFEGVESGEGVFDGPAYDAEAGTVSGAASGDDRCDAASADHSAVLVVVVAAVGVQVWWSAPWAADHAADRWNGVDQGDQFG